MDEKTRELRDIFVDVTEGETVTESQQEGHGSLATDAEIDDRLHDVVDAMRERLDFRTDLDDDALVRLVRGFYAGDDDTALADTLGVDEERVVEARRDLHLVQPDVADAPLDLDALRRAIETGDPSDADLAADLDSDPDTVREYRRVARIQTEIRSLNDRYRAEFESILQDRDLAERLTTAAQEDGLEEATEGQETNTNL
ncbi:conditioned medium-induced protein 4 [Halarchaeum salinum]|uniref:Conditioned medium-induced protein 4 n=1 Tax=Halarchaeum salinum TaxID=489912 RepID=A0AAV3S7B6_9EURY